MPPAAKNLFEKRFLDLQKLFSYFNVIMIDLLIRSWYKVEK